MKDTKFIELLNLYLDHQISETDAAALEAEIRQNPARHRLYRQYCQMHKACAQLSAQFATEAPARTRVAPAGRSRRLATFSYFGAGLAAAAACVAVIVMNRPDTSPAGAPALAVSAPAAAFPTATPLPPPAAPSQELRTVFTTQALAQLDVAPGLTPVFVTATADSFDWMNDLRLNPVQTTPVVFESSPARAPDRETFRSRRPFQATVEMTAYQFQK